MAQPELVKDIEARVKISGDTMTGNLIGKYFQGTWLQTSQVADLGKSPSRIAVIRDDGWLYYRTPSELASDIGLTGNYVLKSGDIITGQLIFNNNTSNQNGYPSIKWGTIQSNTPFIGYATDQTDGTFIITSLKGTTYATGLAIGGSSQNLLYKGQIVLNASNFNQYALPLTGGTMTGGIVFTESNGIQTRHVDGESTTFGGDLYLNYGVNAPIHVGHGGAYIISADGSYYSGKANTANSALTMPEIYNNTTRCVNIKTFMDTNSNLHKASGYGGEFNLYRFFAAGDEGNYSTSYNLPCVDSHVLTFSIDSNTSWTRLLALDMRSTNIYTITKSNGIWGTWKRVWVEGNSVTSAVWNDYAECREADTIEPGYVLIEKGDDTLTKSIERLQPFAGVSSDTWGFSQGETEKAKTPIAVAGRVLVYTYRDRNEYKPGDCVCTAPGGTIDIMTRDEIINYPDRIVGIVSNVPNYKTWGGGEEADRDPVSVNGRIWIKVK